MPVPKMPKIPCIVFLEEPLPFKMKPLRKSVFLCYGKNQLKLCHKSFWKEQPFILCLFDESLCWNRGLDKSRMCVCDIRKTKDFTNCQTWLFFNKYAHEHTFLSMWSNFDKLGVHAL